MTKKTNQEITKAYLENSTATTIEWPTGPINWGDFKAEYTDVDSVLTQLGEPRTYVTYPINEVLKGREILSRIGWREFTTPRGVTHVLDFNKDARANGSLTIEYDYDGQHRKFWGSVSQYFGMKGVHLVNDLLDGSIVEIGPTYYKRANGLNPFKRSQTAMAGTAQSFIDQGFKGVEAGPTVYRMGIDKGTCQFTAIGQPVRYSAPETLKAYGVTSGLEAWKMHEAEVIASLGEDDGRKFLDEEEHERNIWDLLQVVQWIMDGKRFSAVIRRWSQNKPDQEATDRFVAAIKHGFEEATPQELQQRKAEGIEIYNRSRTTARTIEQVKQETAGAPAGQAIQVQDFSLRILAGGKFYTGVKASSLVGLQLRQKGRFTDGPEKTEDQFLTVCRAAVLARETIEVLSPDWKPS